MHARMKVVTGQMMANMMKKADPTWRDLKIGTLNANLNPALETAPLNIFCPQASQPPVSPGKCYPSSTATNPAQGPHGFCSI